MGIMFIGASSMIVQNSFVSDMQTEYIDDPKVGMIEYKIYTPTIWDRILSVFSVQQAAFGTTSLKVGEQTTLYDTIPAKINGQFVMKVVFGIYKDGGRTGIYPVYYVADGLPKKMTVTFFANQPGKYRAATELYLCPLPFYNSNSCSLMSYTGGASMNELTVSDATPVPVVCNDKSGWSSWSKTSDISNGYVQKREYTTVSSDCKKSVTTNEYKTICNSGFIIEGTSSSSSGSGQKVCVIKPEEPPTPPVDPILETCFDGIKNQDETGIDCGGSMCSACSIEKTPGFAIEFNKCKAVDDKADYITLETCEAELEKEEEKGIDWFFQTYGIAFVIGFGVIMLILIMLIIKNFMARRR
jgi:hypothetical protein